MDKTVPVFILGSGRCGTFQISRLLERVGEIEAHHEYLFENILKSAVLYRMNAIKNEDVKSILTKTHRPAIHYSEKKFWVDSSNALPWIIEPLYEMFPNARFIHLIRDGRKVVSSFYNKFSDVVYDDRCVSIVNEWIENPQTVLEPSPEKKYWRPFPVKGDPFFDEFKKYNRFQKLCYYWQDVNLSIRNSLKKIPDTQKSFVRLEDLTSNTEALNDFLEIFDTEINDNFIEVLKKPANVAIPKNFPLSQEQRKEFNDICGNAMSIFDYDSEEEYSVTY
jgi:hypothetical protein